MTSTTAGMQPRHDAGSAEDVALFSAFTLTATFWLLLTTGVGLLESFKFPYPDLGAVPWLSFGRLRAIHTNGTFYGWASVALVGTTFWVAARSSGVALAQKKRGFRLSGGLGSDSGRSGRMLGAHARS